VAGGKSSSPAIAARPQAQAYQIAQPAVPTLNRVCRHQGKAFRAICPRLRRAVRSTPWREVLPSFA
jgi:hypothetical protein